MPMLLNTISWMAIIVLAASYWFQIYKTHMHKEVRDISLTYHVLLALGFGVLIITAYVEDSTIFFWKQILTFIPVCVIIMQILYHQRDHWHDDKDFFCPHCKEELEPDWNYCPNCGSGD